MSHSRLFRSGLPRSRALLALPLLAATLVIAACVPPAPAPTTTTTTTTTTTLPDPEPVVTGEACQPNSGVTVVVDFTALDNTVKIGCAPGEPANGLAALAATGFSLTDAIGLGSVCTIDGLPVEGFPFCWSTGGFWGYWKSPDRSTPWDFAPVGATAGPLPEGSVEGWAWAPDFDGEAPRVSIADLAQYTPPLPVCAVPTAPVLSIIDDDEELRFTIPGGGPIEVATLPAADDPATAAYVTTSTQALAGMSGATRVLARSAADDCTPTDVFDAVYDVRDTYTGRPDLAGSSSTAVAATSPSLIGWASGFVDYLPGADVTANFQTPANAVGAYGNDLAVLGNGGRITMTFANVITNGAGDDFAVFENGFNNGAQQALFTELAYVEVSSNGADFVRFDSASRQPTSVAAFGFQDPRLLGGLAGKDQGGWGTVFDLTALSNKAAVRNLTVDLSAITHVRLVDIVGANDYPNAGDTYPDSFGRQIFDAHKTTGGGGFDLRAIGVLNQA